MPCAKVMQENILYIFIKVWSFFPKVRNLNYFEI